MNIEFPGSRNTEGFFDTKTGKYVLLNVVVESREAGLCYTSVVVFKNRNGAAAWRRKEKNKAFTNWLGFQLTDDTICMSYDDVNTLADNFHAIHAALPEEAIGPNGKFAIGTIPRDEETMGQVLEALERESETIVKICEALRLDLNTSSHARRRGVGKSIPLMLNGEPSKYGADLLEAFVDSQLVYGSLPELTAFGTTNVGRSRERPGVRGALLRYYMQHKTTNPLGGAIQLNYVDYEIKPLNIADSMLWNCDTNPRTDSVDLLLSFQDAAVLTEVKMAGDSFVSSAVVQLLYYASTMANDCQHRRLQREFPSVGTVLPWLCVIAEERVEAGSQEFGFAGDADVTNRFLRHEETKRVLGRHFQGMFVIIVRQDETPFDKERAIPAFRAIQEHRIDWR